MIDTAAFRHVSALGLATALQCTIAPGAREDRCRVLCPWHGDTRPSCDLASKDWGVGIICRVCGEKTDHIGFAAAMLGLDARDFRTVALRLGDLLGVQVENDNASPRPAARPMRDPVVDVATRLDAMADDWLAGRAFRPADLAAVDAAGVDVGLEALGLLRASDEDEREEDERRAVELDRLADEWDRAHG